MKLLKNNKGVTLLVVLILAAVALLISAGLLYLITEGTKMSGSSKRYKTALEAAKAGADITYQLIDKRADPGIQNINFTIPNAARLFDTGNGKLYASTAGWPAGSDRSITIVTTDNTTYDVSFKLGAYMVYAKITDTVKGNSSGAGTHLHGGGTSDGKSGAGGSAGQITAESYPFLYSIEILSQGTTSVSERAKLSILYQY